jgi:hypothetical protein
MLRVVPKILHTMPRRAVGKARIFAVATFRERAGVRR